MRSKSIIISLLAGLLILGSCAEETCPVAMSRPEYHFKKKVKGVVKYRTKRKPTPSLIHITRVTYKPGRNGN